MKRSKEERTATFIEGGKATRFGQPGGNIPGMSGERARLFREAAEKAARIQDKLLDTIEAQLDDVLTAIKEGTIDSNDLASVVNKPNTVALIKMIQDRELGTPRQSLDLSNSDGSLAPPVINIGFLSPNTDDTD